MKETINIELDKNQTESLLVSILLTGYLMQSQSDDKHIYSVMRQVIERADKAGFKDLCQCHFGQTSVSDTIMKQALTLLSEANNQELENLDEIIKICKESYSSGLN